MSAPAFPLVTSQPLEDQPPPEPPPVLNPFGAFPAGLELALASVDNLDDDVKIDRATDGTGRAQMFYSAPKHRIDAALNGLSSSDWTTFDEFYRANRAQVFTVPWGECGAHYDLPVMFSTPPKRVFLGNGRSTVTFTLVEFP